MNETILVTGGAGFIGSALVRQLMAETDARVVNVDALTYAGNLDSLGPCLTDPRHVLAELDIRDGDRLRTLLAEHRPAAILHLAAESHVDRSIDGAAPFIQTNVVGTYALLEAVRAYWRDLPAADRDRFRLLHVSTDEVFGSLGPDGAFTEASPYDPRSPYAASKAASDHLVRAWHHTYGLPVLLTNCCNNFGPRQFPEKLIPLVILRAVAGLSVPVYGDGLNVRDWIHVDDHVRALRAVLERGQTGHTYNVGARSERTNLAVVRALCSLLDELRPRSEPYEKLITYVPDRPGHDRRYAIEPGKLMSELGWRPQETFESGLRQTVQWYLDNSTWCERVTSGKYRLDRLGLVQATA